jgi:hypothetical protein
MLHFRLVVFDLLAEPSHVELVLTSIDALFEFQEAA